MFRYPEETTTASLIRPATGVLVAYSQKCTHLSCAVVPRPEQGVHPLPVPRGILRPRVGPPARRAAAAVRCRGSSLEVRGDDIYATGVDVRTV